MAALVGGILALLVQVISAQVDVSVVGKFYAFAQRYETLRIKIPRNTRDGDLVVAFVGGSGPTKSSYPSAPFPEEGWTEIVGAGAKDINQKAYYKVYRNMACDDNGKGLRDCEEYKEPSIYEITGSKSTFVSMVTLRGVNLQDPLVDAKVAMDSMPGLHGASRAPPVMTLNGGAVLAAFVYDDGHHATVTTPGFVNLVSFRAPSNDGMAVASYLTNDSDHYGFVGPIDALGGSYVEGAGNEIAMAVSFRSQSQTDDNLIGRKWEYHWEEKEGSLPHFQEDGRNSIAEGPDLVPDPILEDIPEQIRSPSALPATSPTVTESSTPTKGPSRSPTRPPSAMPTMSPTLKPTLNPTKNPTSTPTKVPSPSPTDSPTIYPTTYPTYPPTKVPTPSPTNSPTSSPTAYPTYSPTKAPSSSPTLYPTISPTTPLITCGSSNETFSLGTEFCYVKDNNKASFSVVKSCRFFEVGDVNVRLRNHCNDANPGSRDCSGCGDS